MTISQTTRDQLSVAAREWLNGASQETLDQLPDDPAIIEDLAAPEQIDSEQDDA